MFVCLCVICDVLCDSVCVVSVCACAWSDVDLSVCVCVFCLWLIVSCSTACLFV